MPPVDGVIKYKTDDKSSGYDLIDGNNKTGLKFQPERGEEWERIPSYATAETASHDRQ